MTTATQGYTVKRSRDAEDREYPWLVIDPEGDVQDQFETRREAEDFAAECQAERDAEEKSERLSNLRWEIEQGLEDCEDEAVLTAIRAMLCGK